MPMNFVGFFGVTRWARAGFLLWVHWKTHCAGQCKIGSSHFHSRAALQICDRCGEDKNLISFKSLGVFNVQVRVVNVLQ